MAKAKARGKAKKQSNKQKEVSEQAIRENADVTIEKKLTALYTLQKIDSKADKIRIIRGELPLEVEDLDDEVSGLVTRIRKHEDEIKSLEKSITERKNAIKDSQGLIKKYDEQRKQVKNNREFESLEKEIEFQNLEIELTEKRINETKQKIKNVEDLMEESKKQLDERKNDLMSKKKELDDIIADTEKEEKELIALSEKNSEIIEERLLAAYKRIRKNARNGLAVVKIERDACGGCFNKIPPQRQLDIRMHKKIIVCEYCGRILVDDIIAEMAEEEQ